ncbi:hypothetical protein J11TS1_16010 [Oceanobacillus sp. J11TS1]|nr:hypothetical protein J11TS1_16010 [Oceanobacillus sp. J11TS1]
MIADNDPNNQLPKELNLHLMNYRFLNTYGTLESQKILGSLVLIYSSLFFA